MKLHYLAALIVSFMLINTEAWGEIKYTVKKGDTLYKISKEFKTGIEDLSKANNLRSYKLILGTTLTIPSPGAASAGSTVKREDELIKLSSLKSRSLKPDLQPAVTKIAAGAGIQTAKATTADLEIEEKIMQISETAGYQDSELKEFMMSVVRQTVGIPYKFGSNTLKGTDCSGYVQMVFSFMGMNIPRSAREQFKIGEPVDKQDLSIGDLIFFKTYASFPSHVGIYLGNNLFVHASSFAKKVTVENLNLPYYVNRFIGAKRVEGIDTLSLAGIPK